MSAIPATEGPEAAQVGPPPPFDAELRPALDAMTAGERPAFTLDNGFMGAVPRAALSRAAVAAQRDWLGRLVNGVD